MIFKNPWFQASVSGATSRSLRMNTEWAWLFPYMETVEKSLNERLNKNRKTYRTYSIAISFDLTKNFPFVDVVKRRFNELFTCFVETTMTWRHKEPTDATSWVEVLIVYLLCTAQRSCVILALYLYQNNRKLYLFVGYWVFPMLF